MFVITCNKEFRSVEAFGCGYCGEDFLSGGLLKQHVSDQHPFGCCYCRDVLSNDGRKSTRHHRCTGGFSSNPTEVAFGSNLISCEEIFDHDFAQLGVEVKLCA
jgi:hypothetical protein